jgi:hypothetical protein
MFGWRRYAFEGDVMKRYDATLPIHKGTISLQKDVMHGVEESHDPRNSRWSDGVSG